MTARRQDNPYNLCHFEFADGRQCCMPATNGNFCRSHHQLHEFRRRAPAEADLSSELAAYFSGPDSSLDVHRALEHVFKELSGNRISTRRAATFGYLGQLILLSKPSEESQSLSQRELHKACDVACRGARQPAEPPQSPLSSTKQSPSRQSPARIPCDDGLPRPK